MTPQFDINVIMALKFMRDHPGGRNRRLTAEERDGKPWVSVAMNFDSREEAEAWFKPIRSEAQWVEREGEIYSDVLGYYKAMVNGFLVYAHFPKVI